MTSSLKIAIEKKEKAFQLVMGLDSGELIEFRNGSNWPGTWRASHEPRIFNGMGTGALIEDSPSPKLYMVFLAPHLNTVFIICLDLGSSTIHILLGSIFFSFRPSTSRTFPIVKKGSSGCVRSMVSSGA